MLTKFFVRQRDKDTIKSVVYRLFLQDCKHYLVKRHPSVDSTTVQLVASVIWPYLPDIVKCGYKEKSRSCYGGAKIKLLMVLTQSNFDKMMELRDLADLYTAA